MKKTILFLIPILFLGCAPKFGSDLKLEINKEYKYESNILNITETTLAMAGIGKNKNDIIINGSINAQNNWWKDIEIKEIYIAMIDEDKEIVVGDETKSITIKAGETKKIPMKFKIKSDKLSFELLHKYLHKQNPKFKGTIKFNYFNLEKEETF